MIAPRFKTPVSPQSPLTRDRRELSPLVLIADDHQDTRALLRYVLERQGRFVVEAADGEEAFSIAQSVQPDLIVMDAGMPGTDGLAAARKIRQDAALRNVPIVFLTGFVQPGIRDAALSIGGTEFLKKPIGLDELERVVAAHLKTASQ